MNAGNGLESRFNMQIRQSIHSDHAKQLDTQGLRREFLVEQVFVPNELTMTYSHIDRIVFGGIMPAQAPLAFSGDLGTAFGVGYFLERRELGLINIGGPGVVVVDGTTYEIGHAEALYVGQGLWSGLAGCVAYGKGDQQCRSHSYTRLGSRPPR